MVFKPQRWKYEPLSIKRQRELSKFDQMRDGISPLVAKGDPLSLLKAQQVLRSTTAKPEQKIVQKHNWMTKIGEQVKERLEAEKKAKLADLGKEEHLSGGGPTRFDRTTHGDQQLPETEAFERNGRPGVPIGVAEAFPELADDPSRTKTYRSSTSGVRDVAAGVGGLGLGTATGILGEVDRGRGAVIGGLQDPLHLYAGIAEGFQHPEQHTGRDLPGVNRLSDRDLRANIGAAGHLIPAREGEVRGEESLFNRANLSTRDIAGGVADIAADPSTYVGAGTARRVLGQGTKAVDDPVAARVAEAVQRRFKPGLTPADRLEMGADLASGGGAARTGNRLLQLPDTNQLTAELGHPPELKHIFNVDRMGRREATAQGNRLKAQSTEDFRSLGKTVKDAKGNLLVRGIAPDSADIQRGQEFAPLVKVLEKPQNYNLTPEQATAVQRLATVPEIVKNEQNAFGVGPRVLEMEEGQQFIWRKANTDSKGTATNKPHPSVGGTRLGGGGDKTRVFEDIDEALDAGVVYAHPTEAFDQNVLGGLKKSVDEHVKALLVPMSDSAAQRVSPALRAKNEYLHQRLTSLKGTLGRLDGRTRAVVDAYTNSASPDLDALYDELGQVASRAGKLPPDVAQELTQTMSDIRKLKPAWRRELRQARQVPAGRTGVPMDVAPALAGRDFEPRVAQKIEDFYRRTARIPLGGDRSISLRADLPVVRAVSNALTPIRATGDLSAIMINQTTTASRHPLTFSKNVALGFRDLVDDANYNRWLASEQTNDGARHSLALVGDVGEAAEFQFSNWMARVPGIKQLNQHYVRFNNRMRVDLYNLAVRARGGAGNVDDKTKEEIARSINRFTGVSNNRATDAETLVSFAPNFTRAHLETLAAAVSKGGVEGSMAREYLGTMLVAGSGLVAGTALAQGRDPREVLTPFDMDALKEGRLHMNPNFMSVRVLGQDVKVFGKYDSLMRLLAVTETAGADAIGEQDAMQLFDAVGNFTGGMGSPAASLLTSLIKGETFSGAAPLSFEGLASNVTPFTAGTLKDAGMSAGANLAEGDFGGAASDLGAAAITFVGGKASPVSPKEKLDIEAQKRFGVDYKSTDRDQRAALNQAHPELVDEYEGSARGVTRKGNVVKAEYKARQEARDEDLLSGKISRDEWKNQFYEDLDLKAGEMKQIYGEREIKTPKDPMEKYAKVFQDAKDKRTGIMDRDKVDAGLAGLTKADREYVDARVGMDDTPIARVFREIREARSARNDLPVYRGFTADQAEDIDEVWQEVRNNAKSADPLDMMRALRYYLATATDLDGAVIAGVRKKINHRLPTLKARTNFDKANPEQRIFYGSGKLTQQEIDFLKKEAE